MFPNAFARVKAYTAYSHVFPCPMHAGERYRTSGPLVKLKVSGSPATDWKDVSDR